VGFTQSGLTATAAANIVTLTEGFASSWKYRNISYQLANATYTAGNYVYNGVGTTNHPADAAQNVPGVFYSDEEGFNWQNNTTNKPPSPDPPKGYQSGGFTTINADYPLFSYTPYHPGFSTEIQNAGIAEAGTRIGFFFDAPGETVTVPNVVYLSRLGSPATVTGVMVLTTTDPNGAGPFTAAPGITTTISGSGLFTYEVLYADAFSVETAQVPFTVSGGGHAVVYATLAPFYSVPGASYATPTAAHPTPTAVPRFDVGGAKLALTPPNANGG
jgi:hypothetical protein